MTTVDYLIALLRTGLLLCPLLVAAHLVRTRFSALRGAPAALLEAILALAWLLVVAELLGLVGAMRLGWLAAALWASAAATVLARNPRNPRDATETDSPPPERLRPPAAATTTAIARASALVILWLVIAQWLLATADALGGGMFSFDVLWYHMPFAAAFAQTGSVTHIQFTQADPFVAYYPASSELFHALGIIAWRNDFLSPVLNLGWMALALLAAWCAGRRWGVQWLTLAGGALLLSLPVLSGTQPGEAFNDIVGLATLMAAVALILLPRRGWLELLGAGLALGLAAGTKYTFLVPGVILIAGAIVATEPGRRRRTAGLLVGGLAVAGGWWYLRALVHTGNPLGLAQSLGPLHLPGASSPLATASEQTVFSEIRHLSLWGSRFAPGLAHAFGPLWPVILILAASVVIAAITLREEPLLRTIALAATVAAITYLFLPTGATGIQQGTAAFAVNLRYVTPALALCLLLLGPVVAIRAPQLLGAVGPGLAATALLAQFEHNLWPTDPSRHVAFLGVGAVAIAGAVGAGQLARVAPFARRRAAVAGAAVVATLAVAAAGDVAQRHYLNRRYLVGAPASAGLGAIYRWAQSVAHARIALYGTVEQYPLYGATDTNLVHYLGQPTPHGGYEPITTCRRWQSTLQDGAYRYLVLTRGPTAAIPPAWSQDDASLTPILHPTADEWVFRVTPGRHPVHC
ncbi:MAG TPA: hypothetical protein VMF14_09065 [Solirubrobacteraceae bacterium]|nr:hypothetical protein [Solirubrobacteraceae bacterium]